MEQGLQSRVDAVLVGGGIMSATLATLLRQLMPDLSILVLERGSGPAQESSEAMNNAGTGHAAYCELNYTPEKADGSVDISKALTINASFETTLQFWASLVEQGWLPEPRTFLNPTPHLSFVWGEANTRFLKTRHQHLSSHPLFAGMAFTEDRGQLREWMPLVMDGREGNEPLAATRILRGTDVDFGCLSRQLYAVLEQKGGFSLALNQEVQDLTRDGAGWRVRVHHRLTGQSQEVTAGFVFLGGGGGSLPLLQKSGIPEAHGYGGFPVSGQWLMCKDQAVVERHFGKVYGKASVGAPPMSVPHLDTRVVDGKRYLLFGPYAGFTTKFLKDGSLWDLPGSLRPSNLKPMAAAGWDNLDLTRYLIGQVFQSWDTRIQALRDFMPTAESDGWDLAIAGQRVQIIKPDPVKGGKLEFGTELVVSADGTLTALLGASPGASTAVATMVDLVHRCFKSQAAEPSLQTRLRALIPSHGHKLAEEPVLLAQVRQRSTAILGLMKD